MIFVYLHLITVLLFLATGCKDHSQPSYKPHEVVEKDFDRLPQNLKISFHQENTNEDDKNVKKQSDAFRIKKKVFYLRIKMIRSFASDLLFCGKRI